MAIGKNRTEMTATEWLAEEGQRIRLPITGSILAAVEVFDALLLKWNKTINLTRLVDSRERARFLYLESFWGARLCPIQGTLIDLGSGCGFPALAFKLTYPETGVVLVESRDRKCHFLKEAIRLLQLEGLEVWTERIEDLDIKTKVNWQQLSWRAVALGESNLARLAVGLPAGGSLIFFGASQSGDLPILMSLAGFRQEVHQSFPLARERVLLRLVKCST
jgi:16S rRNA (guanine(527)-N(7))-methyltransferase RsmG